MKTLTKILLLTTLIINHSPLIIAQNLVPNPSFEDTVACPDNASQISYANGWSSFRNTPDYYNKCCTVNGWSIPNNSTGYQETPSESCNAYIGLYSSFMTTNNPEYAGTRLVEPLKIGYKYFVSFKINLANLSNCATNNMGVLFSTAPFYDSVDYPLRNFAQVYSIQVITDTLNWTIVSGAFIADSAYEYIVLGNFFCDSLTSKIILNGNSCLAPYYLLDDICVSTDSVTCNPFVPACSTGIITDKITNTVTIYPNPFNDKITIEFSNATFQMPDIILNDIVGKVYPVTISKCNNCIEIIPKRKLPDGIYILIVSTDKYNLTKKVIHFSN